MTFYRFARNLYQRLFNREHWGHRAAQRELLRQFVPRGGLAFDIGANRGEVSGTLLELGARVVAVEPNPVLADEIERHFGRDVEVASVAVGAETGKAKLKLGRDTGHSTLSEEWLERAPTPDRWEGSVVTEVTTLDALIEKYGLPDFIKIDVEAYEAEVLAGLSAQPEALCFEYQTAMMEVAERCLARLGPNYEFALTRGEDPSLVSGWMDAAGARDLLRSLDPDTYGDVFARRRGDRFSRERSELSLADPAPPATSSSAS